MLTVPGLTANAGQLNPIQGRYCSYVSQYVTLLPGDVIYTGTPGSTKPIRPGDVVEVEVEGVGVLRNRVVQQR